MRRRCTTAWVAALQRRDQGLRVGRGDPRRRPESGEARLDEPALAAVGERALSHLLAGLTLAGELTPDPQDLAVARSVGQLATVLARLGATEDWGALMLEGPSVVIRKFGRRIPGCSALADGRR